MEFTYNIQAMNIENAGIISSNLKQYLKTIISDKKIIRRIVIAVYEAEINVVIHSYGGSCNIKIFDNFIKIIFKDTGPGISCIKEAMKAGYSTASEVARAHGFGAGMGLLNIKNASDEFEITSNSSGTTLELTFYLSEKNYASI